MNTKVFSRAIIVLVAMFAAMNLWALPSYNDVLVVINPNSSESVEIGNYFKARRNIPDTNICSVIDSQDNQLSFYL